MRIIWFTPGFAGSEDDTEAVPYLQQLALELQQQSADLHIIALEYPYTRKPYRWHGIPVYPCNGQNRHWLKWRTALYAWKHGALLCKNQPAVVFQSFWLGWAALLAERLAAMIRYYRPRSSVAHFCTFMGQDALPGNRGYRQKLYSNMKGRLLCLSAFHKEKTEQALNIAGLQIMPFGIRANEIRENFTENHTIDILGVGSLVPIKNWDRWLQIIAEVVATRPDIQAVLIGKGPLEGHLRHQIRLLGIEHQVSVRSDLDRPAIIAFMRNAKTLLHTADFESQGYVFVEAAAQGCYLVSTPVGIAPTMADCSDLTTDLSQKVSTALTLPKRSQPVVPFRMEDTARTYLNLYQSYFTESFAIGATQ